MGLVCRTVDDNVKMMLIYKEWQSEDNKKGDTA